MRLLSLEQAVACVRPAMQAAALRDGARQDPTFDRPSDNLPKQTNFGSRSCVYFDYLTIDQVRGMVSEVGAAFRTNPDMVTTTLKVNTRSLYIYISLL